MYKEALLSGFESELALYGQMLPPDYSEVLSDDSLAILDTYREEDSPAVYNGNMAPFVLASAFREEFPDSQRKVGYSGFFRRLGGRMYVDCVTHPEYATPEARDASQVVALLIDGELRWADAVGRFVEEIADINQGYDMGIELSNKTTQQYKQYEKDKLHKLPSWSSHESFQMPRAKNRKEKFQRDEAWAVYLMTRGPLIGAGGYVEGKYYVHPRSVVHINPRSNSSTSKRPVVDTRDQPLDDAQKYERQHIITGEGNISPLQLFYRAGVGPIVARAISDGEYFSDLAPESPKDWAQIHQRFGTDVRLQSYYEPRDRRHGRLNFIEAQEQLKERITQYAVTPTDLEAMNEWGFMLRALKNYRENREFTEDTTQFDWIMKMYIERQSRKIHNLHDREKADTGYHKLTNYKGNAGVGILLRNNGRFRRTPEIDREARDELPRDQRAVIRGQLSERDDVTYLNWVYCRMKVDGVQKWYKITSEGVEPCEEPSPKELEDTRA